MVETLFYSTGVVIWVLVSLLGVVSSIGGIYLLCCFWKPLVELIGIIRIPFDLWDTKKLIKTDQDLENYNEFLQHQKANNSYTWADVFINSKINNWYGKRFIRKSNRP